MTIFIYLLKTIVVFVTLFSLYQIFLKDITFLQLRRWYLICTLFLSFLIPCANMLLLPQFYFPEPKSVLARIDDAVRQYAFFSRISESLENNMDNMLVFFVLGTGFVLATIRYIFTLGAIYRFLKESHLISENEQYSLRTGNKGNSCFCFLKTIYLFSPSLNEQNINIILEHEKAHIRQRHYFDMWLSAICDFFFWFCPFIKYFRFAWEEVLECLADREAINTLQIEPIIYQSVLYANMGYSNSLPVFNYAFGRSLVAKRLLFISQKPTHIKRIVPRLLFFFVTVGFMITSLVLLDTQFSRLRKINEIRNTGYDLHEVITGYVVDSDTGKPVTHAIVKGNNAIAITDHDGFFFIEKASSKLSVQHIAYSNENTMASGELIILIDRLD